MPKISRKPPAWLPAFCQHVKKAERKRDVHHCVDYFAEIVEHHWANFHEAANAAQEEKKANAPKKVTDPIKTLGKAMDKVAARVDEVRDNEPLLQQIKEKVNRAIPPQVREVIVEGSAGGVGSAMDTSPEGIVNLVTQASQNLVDLAIATQKVTSHAQHLQHGPLQQDANAAATALEQVVSNIGQLRESLQITE